MLALVLLAAWGTPRVAWSAYVANPDEMALLALANEARAKSGLLPFVWNQDLGEAAQVHSVDMASHGCFTHDSCNGESWSKRISRYYTGWSAIGENIGGGGTPRDMHTAWMSSSGHKANILGSFTEFGAGTAVSATKTSYATEDFGRRSMVAASSYPTLPAGAVIPRVGYAENTRELIVNYFDSAGTPKAVRALVGSSCVNLSKTAGSASNGTYGTTRLFPTAGCVPVVFEAIRADGVRVRWPQSGAINVGTGTASLSCPAWTSTAPTQDCGGGGAAAPTPTPAPAPTPGNEVDSGLSGVKVVLRPTSRDPSVGGVTVQATLPSVAGLDPSSSAVSITVLYGQGQSWTRVVPQTCGESSCLSGNAKETSYRWSIKGARLNLALDKYGRWKLRYSGHSESLGTTSSGPVVISVTAGGQTFSGTVYGEVKNVTLVAD